MRRYRSRSRGRGPSPSYSPRRVSRSPPRRKRYDDPRDRRGFRRSPAPSGLLVRNVALDARPEDLRIPFERFGPLKDVYLPKNYYTGEPRGFGFVKFRYADDAAVAKQQMNHQLICGREISIVYAEENRKTPQEMRTNSRISDRYKGDGYRRRSSPRSPRHQHHSYSRSPSPPRRDSRDRKRSSRDDYYSPAKSISPPREEREYRSNRRSPTPQDDGRGPSPRKDSRGPFTKEDSRSPSRSRSPSCSR
ncbi:serine/arginine-rich SC35-like splicing factor SCL28 isoform X2 [Ananas comosus]|uniref:Serine/arginine-rich SC35-like splicing factor SCL28 isoform X2 n=1 Tax=Ananas comosus TaxID=4615 RepID=A0A6P5F0Y2_ANACO|nr:serine/arginine-rich SC35-like splicing factor SCL28 isoform X2 [Ananas comosus]